MKSYMTFRLVPKSVTLNDLELLQCVISLKLVNLCSNNHVDLWRNLCKSLLYFVVCAQCRRKESSRSLFSSPDEFLVINTNISISMISGNASQ